MFHSNALARGRKSAFTFSAKLAIRDLYSMVRERLVLFAKFLCPLLQIVLSDLCLVGVNKLRNSLPRVERCLVKIAGPDRGLKRPVMPGQGEIVQHHRDLVGVGGLPNQGVSTGALRALQVFKHHNGHFGPGRRL